MCCIIHVQPLCAPVLSTALVLPTTNCPVFRHILTPTLRPGGTALPPLIALSASDAFPRPSSCPPPRNARLGFLATPVACRSLALLSLLSVSFRVRCRLDPDGDPNNLAPVTSGSSPLLLFRLLPPAPRLPEGDNVLSAAPFPFLACHGPARPRRCPCRWASVL